MIAKREVGKEDRPIFQKRRLIKMIIQKPKGTKDLLPDESYKWQYIEQKIKNIFVLEASEN